MRRNRTRTAWILLGCSVAVLGAKGATLGPKGATLDPREPMTVSLKDAKVVDLVTTLGALADLPVEIGPGVEGTITLELSDVPFETVLEIISHQLDIRLRIEGGRLIASKALQPVPPAPVVGEELRDAPRIPIEEYARAARDLLPLTLRVGGEAEPCHVADFAGREERILEARFPDAPEKSVVLADLGWDPVARLRYVALETSAGDTRRLFALAPGERQNTALGDFRAVSLSMPAGQDTGDCLRDFVPPEPVPGARSVMVQLMGRSIRKVGQPTVVFAARVQITAGKIAYTLTGPDPLTGEIRGFSVSAYVSRDASSIALVCKVRAVWSDPADGRQYYYTQTGQSWSEFLPLRREETLATTIPPGAATRDPVEIRVSRTD